MTTIFGYIRDIKNQPQEGVEVILQTVSKASDDFNITKSSLTSISDSAGYFAIDILPGVDVEILVPKLKWRKEFTVPSSGTFNISSL